MDIRAETARERLKDSLEMRDIKRNILIWLLVTPTIGGLMGFRGRNWSESTWMLYGAILAGILVIAVGFYAIRIFRIYRKPEHYIFSQVVLAQPRPGLGRNTMYFDVTVTDPNGNNYPVSTHAIFNNRGFFGLRMEDYVNKTVTVGFNTETGMVVVIG